MGIGVGVSSFVVAVAVIFPMAMLFVVRMMGMAMFGLVQGFPDDILLRLHKRCVAAKLGQTSAQHVAADSVGAVDV